MMVCCISAHKVFFRPDGEDLRFRDDQRAAIADHRSLGNQQVPFGRRQQVQLVFDGEHPVSAEVSVAAE